jgi:DNA-binding transcriptional ArsR family regulator
MASGDDRWLEGEASPVVRPYALVRGRTKPAGEALDVVAMACAVRRGMPDARELEPEHLAVLRHCGFPATVAEVASALDLPLGVIRILLADLRDRGLVTIHRPRPKPVTDIRILREVADGLRRL